MRNQTPIIQFPCNPPAKGGAQEKNGQVLRVFQLMQLYNSFPSGQLHQQCCEKWTLVNDETQAKMARMSLLQLDVGFR